MSNKKLSSRQTDGEINILRRSQDLRKIAFTFDDGPDPTYTPQILDVLSRYGTKATFFMLSAKARHYPYLVEAIAKEGHHLACHGLRHRPEPTMGRQTTYHEMQMAVDIFYELTGNKPRYYRPPWGVATRFTLESIRRFDMKMVLWSCDSGDWLWGTRPQVIAHRILNYRDIGGSIVLCHDGSFVPHRQRTLMAALPNILSEIKERGHILVDLTELDT